MTRRSNHDEAGAAILPSMATVEPSSEVLDVVRQLIRLLNSRPALSPEDAKRRHRAYLETLHSHMLSTGLSQIQRGAVPGTAIQTTDEAKFRQQLKTIDNNLEEQVRIVVEGVQHYFENGETPAPYYAWRIAVILRKAKQYDLEADFVEAFSHKFRDGPGARYKQIAARSKKARALAAEQRIPSASS